MIKIIKNTLFLFLLITSFKSTAETINRETANLCASAIYPVETQLGLPKNVLKAISLKETGRWDNHNKQSLSWPWTVTSRGKGVYHKTEREAIRAVRELQQQGIKNVDVGCMQVNLYYHPHAFKNLQDAFNPQLNVNYAGNFLTQLFEDHGSWQTAIEHYHSNDKQRGQRYRLAVEKLRKSQNLNFTNAVSMKATSEWFSKQKQLKLDLHSAKEKRIQNTIQFKTQRKKENERLRKAFIERKANVLKRWKKMMEKRKQKSTSNDAITQS